MYEEGMISKDQVWKWIRDFKIGMVDVGMMLKEVDAFQFWRGTCKNLKFYLWR